ncbi:CatA-like O-acetyltransferase [Enterococcus sp. AZ109]|uniref:CatA-like O-acetyltransferase n=1 Tax=Enterococcus sp. AZ109 TaxID=2774634 RepID=UPI003F21718E
MSKFHEQLMTEWPRAESFYYYSQIAPTSYSITVKLNVTKLKDCVQQRGLKFFPAYLYAVSRVVSQIKELKMAVRDGTLGYWDYLNPVYPQFHPEDQTVSLLWTEYSSNLSEFYQRYLSDTEEFGHDRGILTKKGVPPENAYVISCIPWFSFDSFSLQHHQLKDYYLPSFEAGKFIEQNGELYMPLSINAHHAATDGYQLKVFLKELQTLMDGANSWME